jgi:hypothetical protein
MRVSVNTSVGSPELAYKVLIHFAYIPNYVNPWVYFSNASAYFLWIESNKVY